MVYFEALGIHANRNLITSIIKETREKPSLIFKGYSGTYFYKNLGFAEFSLAEVENSDGSKELKGFNTHLSGYHNYEMKVSNLLNNKNMLCCCICHPVNDKSIQIPISFVMSDVLPSILPGDTVVFQGIAFLESGKFYLTEDDADNDTEIYQQRKIVAEKPEFAPKAVLFKGDGSPDDGVVAVYTKVHGLKRYPSYIQTGNGFSSIFTVEANSSFGDVTIAVPEEYLTPEIIRKLEKNQEVLMYGYLHFSGDVGIQKHQQGAIFDEPNLLRVLRQALETCELERLEKNLSQDCEYYGTSGRRLSGKDACISQIRTVLDAQHEDKNDIQHQAIATVIDVTDPEKAEYGIGKECLLSYSVNSEGHILCQIFIDVEDEKISALKFTYEPCYRFKIDENTLLRADMPIFTEIKHR